MCNFGFTSWRKWCNFLKAEEGDAVLVGQVVCLIDTKATKPKNNQKVNEFKIEEKLDNQEHESDSKKDVKFHLCL